ncbi:FxSxx-COOH system tetratricopeptide repeat protein [Umezawaea sp. Da 62-37]|uniref:FxSxx-COOH system tetratricopeptide repeat protein n=1 Tax=Umezawaea sp. Da 62-37 TaxID=3075927 RepID=UPI0028F6E3E8|nr:FxSxx-COOH system tetratricopeptide repeat protein [Umezawaea sp. Da 62-37]WNV88740.1 FxSxx-COOH system tetratricopeptide repeat protein [Umezawaea sp. Da 62-37]
MTAGRRGRIGTGQLRPDELADALWLATHIREAQGGPPRRRSETPAEPFDPPTSPDSEPPERSDRDPAGGPAGRDPGRIQLSAEAVRSSGPPGSDRRGWVRWSGTSQLPDARAIARALRPLMRTVPSPVDQVLDEEATAVRAAEEGLWLPERRPAQVHPFDVVLVVDDSVSMRIWHRCAAEFRGLLQRQGAFRDVRMARLDTDRTGNGLVLRGPSVRSSVQAPAMVTDPTGRRIVLLLTDGVGASWRTGGVHDLLTRWGRNGPVAVLQVLPSGMWASWSGITTRMARWSSPAAMLPAVRWTATPVETGVADDGPGVLPVPVLELDGRWFGRWVDLVTATGSGEVELPALRVTDPDHGETGAEVALDPVERVLRFRRIATPTAFRLAVLFAAAPLSIPMMRVVQEALMPASTAAHLAEVFLGGLIRPYTHSVNGYGSSVLDYDFHPGVRSELLAGGARSDTSSVFRLVEDFLGARVEAVGNLREVLSAPDTAEIPVLSVAALPFVHLQHDVLRALSGPYVRRAITLAGVLSADSGNSELVSAGSQPVGSSPARRASVPRPWPAGPIRNTDGVARIHAHRDDDVTALSTHSDAVSPHTRPAEQPAVLGAVPLRNVNFTGRAELLDDLHTRLNQGDPTAVLPEALHGLGGIGKSQIAVEFVHRHMSDYDLIWWISAEDVDQIQAAYVNLCIRLGLRAEPAADTAVPAVLEALRVGEPYRRWLLIFDNADAPEDVRRYFPHGAGHVLITSRNASWASVASSLSVDVFTREESRRLLQRRNPDLPDADAERLAEVLGDLPLAVDQAAAWRAETGMSADEYVELFEDKRAELLSIDPPPTDYPLTVAAAWNMSLDRLREQHPAALELLQVCSFFAPEPIARKLLAGVRNLPFPQALADALRNPVLLGRAIREINRYSLARIDHRRDTIQLHRLVQTVLRSQMNSEEQQRMRHVAHLLLANGDPNQPEDVSHWQRYQELLPHVRATRLVEGDDGWVRKLAINMANFLFAWGDPERARELAAEMVEIWKGDSELGEDDLDTLIASRWHGRALRALGRYAESGRIAEHTLERLQATLGDDHEETLLTAHGVASDLRARGEFQRARLLNEDTYRRARRAFGDDDPETLRAANNYALSMRLTGDLQAARALDDDTWRRRAITLGDDHRFTLLTLDNLSVDLRECGDYNGACRFQEVTVQRFRDVVGSHNSLSLSAIKNLSVARRKAGDHEGGRLLSDESYRGLLDRYGARHPDAMSAGMNHSVSLRQTKDLKGARQLGDKVWSLYRDAMGEDHPFALAGATNLAVTLRLLGDPGRAREINERAFERFEQVLTPDHFFTLVCATNLASDLHAMGEFQAAYDMDVVIRERSERVLGADHPSTLALDANIALDLRGLGETGRAEEVQGDVVTRFQRVLGPGHPASMGAMQNIRADCDIDPMQI